MQNGTLKFSHKYKDVQIFHHVSKQASLLGMALSAMSLFMRPQAKVSPKASKLLKEN